ncbi:Methyltransferase domain protein [compost metagenome]
MALRFTIDYLRHRLTANSRHGTHSPFVYRLVDEVIYDFSEKKVYEPIENLRKKLLNDDTEIEITDFGAGSLTNNNRRRKLSQLAASSLKSPRLAQLIYRLASDHPANQLLELGTCLGITTAYLARANPQAKLTTIEGCPETAKAAARNFRALNLPDMELLTGNFDALLPPLLKGLPRLDFIYVDGNHTKEATLRYFYLSLAKAHEGTLMLFDDIYWSSGMKEAWQEIKAHPQVTVTIDLFWIGLVYFRKGQAKEHFKIRF